MTSTASPMPPLARAHGIALAVILLIAFALRLNQLGHADVQDLDEVFHAIVARNLIDAPLKPTLYDVAYLPFDYRNWQANHVWLHKPPVALWQMAVSLSAFGDSTFALRLPSLILSTAAVGLTFLIARALGDPRAGLVAAGLQALNPFLTRLVHGQVFSDHVDVALLFWTELAVLLLLLAARTRSMRFAILAGLAQGVAWLTKSHPALFVTGLAIVLAVLPRLLQGGSPLPPRPLAGPSPATRCDALPLRSLAAFLFAAIAAALPWTLWCAVQFPREFAYEQLHVVQHLYADVEQFAAPWDRLLFDYLLRALLEWWPLAAFSILFLAIDAYRRRDVCRAVVALWAIGVLVPHVLAASKTPSATLVGWPAAWIAIGLVVSDAFRRRRSAIAAVVTAGLLMLVWRQWPRDSIMGYGENYRFGSILLAHWPLLAQVALVSAAAVCFRGPHASGDVNFTPSPTAFVPLRARLSTPLMFLMAAILVAVTVRHATLAYRTSNDVDRSPLAFRELGKIVRRQSPPEAVFLVDVRSRNEHLIAMWWLDRACYPLRPDRIVEDVQTILDRGGQPFVLSRGPWGDATPVLRVAGEGAIYRVDR